MYFLNLNDFRLTPQGGSSFSFEAVEEIVSITTSSDRCVSKIVRVTYCGTEVSY